MVLALTDVICGGVAWFEVLLRDGCATLVMRFYRAAVGLDKLCWTASFLGPDRPLFLHLCSRIL